MKNLSKAAALLFSLSLSAGLLAFPAMASESQEELPGTLTITDGAAQPMLTFTSGTADGYTNEDSDILRYCAYVETDHDTDADGKADLVKVFVQVPRAAAEGKYKAGVIYDPTPYNSGTVDSVLTYGTDWMKYEADFDFHDLYAEGTKRQSKGSVSSLDMAADSTQSDWYYSSPAGSTGYSYIDAYNYFLVRGYAVVQSCGIGTYGSEGYELCGMDLECESHKNVIEWLTGNRVAYSDRWSDIETAADWSNGSVAMIGCSYGGTLPYEVATTGVEGLKTVVPIAGIASWYDYTNSQGVTLNQDSSYTDYLAEYNAGATFEDDDWLVPNDRYGSFLYQIEQLEDESNGDYADIWDKLDYSHSWENIKCSAFIIHGLNDFNVQTKQADLMHEAFVKAGAEVKMLLHQDGHNVLDGTMVGDMLAEELLNKWFCHYLYGEENGMPENIPAVMVQSNVDSTYYSCDKWREFNYTDVQAEYQEETTTVSSQNQDEFAAPYMEDVMFNRDEFYLSLPDENAAKYPLDVEAGTTIYGVPEIHLSLSTETTDAEGLMVTAVLIDTAQDGSVFKAFMVNSIKNSLVPVRTYNAIDIGGGLGEEGIKEFVKTNTTGKALTYGWTDLTNPGLGYDASEYTQSTELEAGKEYDYTIYLNPTVYTLEEGHQLNLILLTWDPYRAFLNESFELDPETGNEIASDGYVYSYTINNAKIDVKLPIL